jgi:hypothetical protein
MKPILLLFPSVWEVAAYNMLRPFMTLMASLNPSIWCLLHFEIFSQNFISVEMSESQILVQTINAGKYNEIISIVP